MIDDMLEENFKYELHWLGMTFNKNNFLSLVKATAEEVRPWETNFEIINEVQFGNVTVIQLVKPRPDKGPPDFWINDFWVGRSKGKKNVCLSLSKDRYWSIKWMDKIISDRLSVFIWNNII